MKHTYHRSAGIQSNVPSEIRFVFRSRGTLAISFVGEQAKALIALQIEIPNGLVTKKRVSVYELNSAWTYSRVSGY